MRQTHKWLLIFLLLSAPCFALETIILTSGEWPPYLSAQLPHQGIVSRIVQEAFAEADIKVVYEFYPWKRSFEMAKEGSRAGSLVWARIPERESFFYFSDPIIETNEVFFYRTDNPFSWETLDDLIGKRIGTTASYLYGGTFSNFAEMHLLHITVAPSDKKNFQLLLAERIDIFPVDIYTGLDILRTHFTKTEQAKLAYSPKPLHKQPHALHLVLNKKDPKNLSRMLRFNAALQALKDKGIYDCWIKEALQKEYLTKETLE